MAHGLVAMVHAASALKKAGVRLSGDLWLTGVIGLFHPQLSGLLQHRDQVVTAWTEQHQDRDTFEDRDLDVTGWVRISVDDQMVAIEQAIS